MTDSKLPSPNGSAKMRTDVELTGKYLLTVVDDSNERWSNPEWVAYAVTKIACLFLLCGGTWMYFRSDLPDEAKVLASSLTMAAGFKLIESATNANNKRPNGNAK